MADIHTFLLLLSGEFLRSQITIGIGNEVRDSTIQLTQMVCFQSYFFFGVCAYGRVKSSSAHATDITTVQCNDFRLTDKTSVFCLLVGQNDAFAETSGILAGTFRRMNNMAQRQGCRWLWYIIFLIFVFWFFIVVWWFRR